ncbi:hypothetical protein [Nocardioides lijunqiniae]|uniref:hypothetical protein n=1 Tax=Nocardioides lijunqiniae TaxID=2760832 RepID=UPI001878957C|nr:hypothetical protein [Nocardioides lijunqiniae]
MDEDPTDDVARALMSLGAGSARALEVTLRAARDAKAREAAQIERDADAAIRRLSGTAAAAESHFAVVDAEWMRAASATDAATVWEASQRWAEIDPDRMTTHAERISGAASEVAGTDLRAAVDDGSMSLEEAAQTLATTVAERDAGAVDHSASADATVARGVEGAADSRRGAVAGDVRDATSRRDRLRTASVPAQAIDARLTADKLSGSALQTAAAHTSTDPVSPGAQHTSARSPARVRAHRKGVEIVTKTGPER